MREIPYDIRKTADGYHVFNQHTGEDKGKSSTRAKAEAHMKALYAHEPRQMSSPGMLGGGNTVLDDTYTPAPITEAYMGGKKYPVVGAPAAQSPDSSVSAPGALDKTGIPAGESVVPVVDAPVSAQPVSAKPRTSAAASGKKGLKFSKTDADLINERTAAPGLLGGGILSRLGKLKGKKAKGKSEAAPASDDKPAGKKSLPPWMAKFTKKSPK